MATTEPTPASSQHTVGREIVVEVKALQKYFGRIPANPKGVPEVITLEPTQPAEQRMVAEIEMTPSVEADYKAVSAVHKDAAALQVLGVVLGGAPMTGRPGMGGPMRPPSGRLHRSLVLDKKVATRASASFRGQKYSGLFAVSATPAPGKRPDEVEPLLDRAQRRDARVRVRWADEREGQISDIAHWQLVGTTEGADA